MIKRIIFLSILFASAVFCQIEEEESVLVLTVDNFEQAIAEHESLLVEFYAPWCGHCKKLAPEYAKAAAALRNLDPPAFIAKVDATQNKALADKFGVKGYPTLKFFKNGQASDYAGGRTEKEIISYMKKKATPATLKHLSSVDEVLAVADANEVAVIGVFSDITKLSYATFQQIASSDEDLSFAYSTNAEVFAHHGSSDKIILFKKFDELKAELEINDETSRESIEKFIAINSIPMVVEYTPEQSKAIFKGPIKVHVLTFVDKNANDFSETLSVLNQAALAHKGEFLHVYVPKSEVKIMNFFDLDGENLPATVIADMRDEGQIKKFRYDGKHNHAELVEFKSSFVNGKLKQALKSAEPSADDDSSPVKVIVGKTFDEKVIENDKDVLLEFYAPWCGHCKSLAPKYEELATKLSSNENIVIAKMDATANEISHPNVAVKGFPSIYFFPSGKKDSPIVYDGARDVEGFSKFLEEHSSFLGERKDNEEL